MKTVLEAGKEWKSISVRILVDVEGNLPPLAQIRFRSDPTPINIFRPPYISGVSLYLYRALCSSPAAGGRAGTWILLNWRHKHAKSAQTMNQHINQQEHCPALPCPASCQGCMSLQQPEPLPGSTLQTVWQASRQQRLDTRELLCRGAAACAALREVLPVVFQLQGVVPSQWHNFWRILSRVLFPGVENQSERQNGWE